MITDKDMYDEVLDILRTLKTKASEESTKVILENAIDLILIAKGD
ncbi:hypothetical protein [Caminicella sporogenes]|nr:hypothetical protein [Caminicella sporogenes]WIF95154.1 hypothetical protein QNI18_00510 [Caminicella sporogenes]